MEIYRPEVHSLFLRPFLDDTRAASGPDAVRSLLAPFEVTEEALRDETAWVSLEFCEAFFERLVAQRGDPTVFDRCGRMVLEPRYMGIIRPILRAFGSPRFTLGQVVQATPRFNKVGRMRILAGGRGFARLEYAPVAGAPTERAGLVCLARAAQLAAIPTMFDLAPAGTSHLACMQSGSPVCIYEFTWKEPRSRLWSFAAGAVGAIGSWAAIRAAEVPPGAAAALALAVPVGAWAVGRVIELRRDIGERARELSESNEALVRSLRLTEDRYAQLLEAKGEVERKVDERTAELRQTSTRLEGVLREVQGLARAKADFFANVSHELRTPLTLIVAPLESLLQRADLDRAGRRHLELIQRSAAQLRRLIDQLLDLEKVDAARVQLRRVPIDLAPFVTALVTAFGPAAAARQLTLRARLPESCPALAADADWLESALNNLLANALKFARSTVEVRVVDQPGAVTVQVQDDGPGIPASDLALVFERFGQSGEATQRRRGTGLGLALAREAARLHGGEVSVESEVGRGSTFSLLLPRRPLEQAAPLVAAPARTPEPIPEPAPVAQPTSDPSAPLVLLVEDEDDLRLFLHELLAPRYRVALARNGVEALAVARQDPPDAVVSDLAMPEMDGLELCRRLRAGDGGGALPFLLLTAWNQQSRVLDAFQAGVDDFVAKPFHGRELLARLDVHLRLRRLIREMAHKERLAALGVMAASLAHQIRNPLTAIRSGVFGLRQKLASVLDERAVNVMDVMIDCTARIERLIAALLDLTKLDREERTTFRPADTIRASLRLVQARLPRQAQVIEQIDEALEIRGRPGDMGHVFLNLIDNALRAISESGEIEIRAARADGAFVFEIGDSGPGVPPEQAEWVFSPFTTRRPAGEGTGLGLYIAREVVRDHGGHISVARSRLGGALFRVEVPLGAP